MRNSPLLAFISSSLFCTLISLIVMLGLIHFTPITEILISHSKYAINSEFKELSVYEQIVAARLVNENKIISVDSLWSMQVSFYQTIVSVLIGLNAAILAVAFLIIRSSSNEHAIKEAKAQFDSYASSQKFSKLVEKKSRKILQDINLTYNDVLESKEQISSQVTKLETQKDQIFDQIDALKNQISAISIKLSKLDKEPSESYQTGNSEKIYTDGIHSQEDPKRQPSPQAEQGENVCG